jgi:hypothetical protein
MLSLVSLSGVPHRVICRYLLASARMCDVHRKNPGFCSSSSMMDRRCCDCVGIWLKPHHIKIATTRGLLSHRPSEKTGLSRLASIRHGSSPIQSLVATGPRTSNWHVVCVGAATANSNIIGCTCDTPLLCCCSSWQCPCRICTSFCLRIVLWCTECTCFTQYCATRVWQPFTRQ